MHIIDGLVSSAEQKKSKSMSTKQTINHHSASHISHLASKIRNPQSQIPHLNQDSDCGSTGLVQINDAFSGHIFRTGIAGDLSQFL